MKRSNDKLVKLELQWLESCQSCRSLGLRRLLELLIDSSLEKDAFLSKAGILMEKADAWDDMMRFINERQNRS